MSQEPPQPIEKTTRTKCRITTPAFGGEEVGWLFGPKNVMRAIDLPGPPGPTWVVRHSAN